MSSTLRALQSLVIGGLGAALFVVTVNVQAGSASEANHFIETPKGWVHPKTAWDDPDLTGMWPVSLVGTVPLERCHGSDHDLDHRCVATLPVITRQTAQSGAA